MPTTAPSSTKTGDRVRWSIVTAAGGILLGMISWWVVDRIGEASWRGGVDKIIQQREGIAKDVSTALGVLEQHGEEFIEVRRQMDRALSRIESVQAELLATRRELLHAIGEHTSDRFRGTDWEREEELIKVRFAALEKRLDDFIKRLEILSQRVPESIPPKWFEREVRNLEKELETLRDEVNQLKNNSLSPNSKE